MSLDVPFSMLRAEMGTSFAARWGSPRSSGQDIEAHISLFAFLDLGLPFEIFPLSWKIKHLCLPSSFVLEDLASVLINSSLFGCFFLAHLNYIYLLYLALHLDSWGDPSISRARYSCISSEWTDWGNSSDIGLSNKVSYNFSEGWQPACCDDSFYISFSPFGITTLVLT